MSFFSCKVILTTSDASLTERAVALFILAKLAVAKQKPHLRRKRTLKQKPHLRPEVEILDGTTPKT
eukprot:1160214-Amphidinium_carterae.1